MSTCMCFRTDYIHQCYCLLIILLWQRHIRLQKLVSIVVLLLLLTRNQSLDPHPRIFFFINLLQLHQHSRKSQSTTKFIYQSPAIFQRIKLSLQLQTQSATVCIIHEFSLGISLFQSSLTPPEFTKKKKTFKYFCCCYITTPWFAASVISICKSEHLSTNSSHHK